MAVPCPCREVVLPSSHLTEGPAEGLLLPRSSELAQVTRPPRPGPKAGHCGAGAGAVPRSANFLVPGPRAWPGAPYQPGLRLPRLPGSREPAGYASPTRLRIAALQRGGLDSDAGRPGRAQQSSGRAAARTIGTQARRRPRPRPLPGDPRGPKGSLYQSCGDITRRRGSGTGGRG